MSQYFDQLGVALKERYQLESELGRGGMATVYLALDLQHGRRVAIKVLHPELAGAVGQDRFLREIRIASDLSHPHILPLLDSGSAVSGNSTLPFYVMPFVEGESLRARLSRERQLPVEEAIKIAHDVATALSYAHSRGVVHRDIKPENILLVGNEAVVADFGIARAINRAADREVITSAGLAVGTPAYMSPEQSTGDGEVDGRSDIYSLGCVLYEMLGGEPPFFGPSANAILARHRIDPVPSLTTIRPTVPPHVEVAVRRALEKLPADRYATASMFAAALGFSHATPSAISTISTPLLHITPRSWVLLVVLVGTAVVVAGTILESRKPAGAASPLDTTLYAIIPVLRDSNELEEFDPSLLLQDALARWTGVNVVDPFQVRAAMSRSTPGDFQKVARELGAGRYVRVDLNRIGDARRVHAVLYDTRQNTQLADRAERLTAGLTNADSVFGSLAERLLFRNRQPRTTVEPIVGTSSVPARQAFGRGYEALENWDLAAADSSFDAATRYDPRYAQATLWLALVRMWSGDAVAQWRSAIERAAAGRDALSVRDRQIADAVLAQAREDDATACEIWKQLAVQDTFSFVAWYGWGDCLRRDNIVIRDGRSPTGWRFRSSYHQALKAYQRALQLLPTVHRAFRSASFRPVLNLLNPGDNDLRGGVSLPPDTSRFVASPSWEGDTLVLFPITEQDLARGRSPRTATTTVALQHQRLLFRDIASGWATAFPKSAEAMEVLALSLEALGDESALDTLRQAYLLATHPVDVVRIAGVLVWMQVKLALPSNPLLLRSTVKLADSILDRYAKPADPVEPRVLASLAALRGRAYLAAALSRHPAVREAWSIPIELAGPTPPLMVFASMGGPSDSLLTFELQVASLIEEVVPSGEQNNARLLWLGYPATVAFPNARLSSILALDGKGDYLIDAFAAYIRHDTVPIRRTFSRLESERRSYRASDLPLDAVYPEAWLLSAIGDDHAAGEWLDPTLNSLKSATPQTFSDALRAGALVRATMFRAELAERAGDRDGARKWASAVSILWQGADDFLQPTVRRAETLAN